MLFCYIARNNHSQGTRLDKICIALVSEFFFFATIKALLHDPLALNNTNLYKTFGFSPHRLFLNIKHVSRI